MPNARWIVPFRSYGLPLRICSLIGTRGELVWLERKDDFDRPQGFQGADPDADESRLLAGIAVFADLADETRKAQISGTLANHARKLGADWVVTAGPRTWTISASLSAGRLTAKFDDGQSMELESDWTPGDQHGRFRVGESLLGVKLSKASAGWRLRFRGVDLLHHVMSPRVHELSRLSSRRQIRRNNFSARCRA